MNKQQFDSIVFDEAQKTLQLLLDSKFGSTNYHSVSCTWPALQAFAENVVEQCNITHQTELAAHNEALRAAIVSSIACTNNGLHTEAAEILNNAVRSTPQSYEVLRTRDATVLENAATRLHCASMVGNIAMASSTFAADPEELSHMLYATVILRKMAQELRNK